MESLALLFSLCASDRWLANDPVLRRIRNLGYLDSRMPKSGLSFLFRLGRTQVRLTSLLYQVSGYRQICFRPRGGLSSARVPSAA